MEITEEQYKKISHYLLKQRGNVKVNNLQMLNAILYVAENGCKWRSLPKEFGNWHTVYTRLNRWAKNGVLEKIFTLLTSLLETQEIIVLSLDSTIIKVHPDGTGALKKVGPNR